MTTPIKYDVTVGVEEAKRALAEFDAALKASDNAALKLDRDIAALELQQKELTAAIMNGGANARTYRLELERVTGSLARMRGQASATASAVQQVHGPTANTGMAFLELSRAVEDAQYGLRGIQNNIPGMIASFGGSAGLAAAVSLVSIAGVQLYEHFTKIPEGVKEAREKSAKELEAMKQDIRDVADELESIATGLEVESIRRQRLADERLTAAGEQARDFIGRFGALDESAMRKIADLANANLTVELDVYDQKTQALKTVKVAASEVVDAYRNVALAADEAQQAQQIAVDAAVAKGLRRLAREEAEADRDAASARRRADAASEKADEKAEDAKLKLRISNMRERENSYWREVQKAEKEAKERAKETDDRLDAAGKRGAAAGKDFFTTMKARADWEAKFRKDTEREVDKANKVAENEQERHMKVMANITVDAMGAIADAIVGAATGQKDAWADLLGFAAEKAGDTITLYGGETLASGFKDAATGNVAGATAGIGTGLALIAAGQAISVGGAAAVGALTGAAGSTSAASGARDPGASPRRSSAPSDGGGLTVNVTYGVAGPQPEDTARAIDRATRAARRRGGR